MNSSEASKEPRMHHLHKYSEFSVKLMMECHSPYKQIFLKHVELLNGAIQKLYLLLDSYHEQEKFKKKRKLVMEQMEQKMNTSLKKENKDLKKRLIQQKEKTNQLIHKLQQREKQIVGLNEIIRLQSLRRGQTEQLKEQGSQTKESELEDKEFYPQTDGKDFQRQEIDPKVRATISRILSPLRQGSIFFNIMEKQIEQLREENKTLQSQIRICQKYDIFVHQQQARKKKQEKQSQITKATSINNEATNGVHENDRIYAHE